ncbi:MAG: hypothetical protein KC656_14245, partial [Myxococcales bacterium]|nr:hypothetical protein [Myxococcales bacterium]
GAWREVFVVLGSVGAGCLALAGCVGFLGASLGGPNLLLLPLVAVLGLADAVHLAHAAGRSGRAEAALAAVALPCALTSLTSALAFLALLVSPSPAVRQFGLLAAVGMGLAWVTGLVLPAAALTFRAPVRPPVPWVPRVHPGVLGAVVVVLLCGAGLTRTDLRLGGELPGDDPVLLETRAVDAALGGIHPVRMVLDTRTPDGTADVDAARGLLRLHQGLESDPAVGAVFSYADVLRWIARGQGMEPARLLVSGPRGRARGFEKAHAEAVARSESSPVALFDADRSAWVLHVRLRDAGAAAWAETLARAQAAARPVGRLSVEGYPALVVAARERIVPELLRVIGVSALAVLVVLGLRTRSLRTTAMGVGVLSGTALGVLGTLGLLGVPLTHTHVFVVALAVGIAVDGWIHLATSDDPRTSDAVVWSAFVWVVGFALLGFSHFPTVRGMGAVLAVAVAVNLLLTLAAARQTGRITL